MEVRSKDSAISRRHWRPSLRKGRAPRRLAQHSVRRLPGYLGLLCCFGLLCCDASALAQDFQLRIDSATVSPGDSVSVSIRLDNNIGATAVAAWSFGVCHDDSLFGITELDITPGVDALAAANGSLGFRGVQVHSGGWSVGTLVDLMQTSFLTPATDLEIEVATYLAIGAGGTSSNVEFCETLGAPPVEVLLTVGVDSVVPSQAGGVLQIGVDELFRRGDANANGAVALNDAVFLLTFLFNNGVEPPCLDAADVNDNGSPALNDAVVILTFLFALGAPPPPPGPDSCGTDPTLDGLPFCFYTSC